MTNRLMGLFLAMLWVLVGAEDDPNNVGRPAYLLHDHVIKGYAVIDTLSAKSDEEFSDLDEIDVDVVSGCDTTVSEVSSVSENESIDLFVA
uniref:Uncharacterized protein n=1 Tax=Timema monikensis TaxID=170555 RepID=A0A7R9EHS6_9NEOP|nr:unnamed protein product [Timema monikensis]